MTKNRRYRVNRMIGQKYVIAMRPQNKKKEKKVFAESYNFTQTFIYEKFNFFFHYLWDNENNRTINVKSH
jgi:ABC-type sulfate transport system substrate-binding protein